MIYLIVALLTAAGATVQSATGFGLPIVLMSLLPVFLPTGIAVSMTAVITLVLNVILCVRFRKKVNWRLLIVPLAAFVIANTAAVLIGQNAADTLLKRVLGGLLIVLSAYFFFLSGKISIKSGPVSGASAGLVSGFMNGLFSIGGPPMVVYLVSSLKDNEEYMGTLQYYFLMISTITVVTRAVVGSITGEVLLLSVSALPGIAAGSLLGAYFFRKLNGQLLKKAVYLVMLVTGLMMLIAG